MVGVLQCLQCKSFSLLFPLIQFLPFAGGTLLRLAGRKLALSMLWSLLESSPQQKKPRYLLVVEINCLVYVTHGIDFLRICLNSVCV